MDLSKTNKALWFLFCFILFLPFLVERHFIAPFTLSREPLYIWGTIHWIYCYISYGAACLLYLKWRKKNNCTIIIKPDKKELKWMCLAVVIGVTVSRLFEIVAVYIFNDTVIHITTPMIYREFMGYVIRTEPIWLGVGTFLMQTIYYLFEFALIAFIIDCSHKTSERMGWSQKIPWGGIFLTLTWGLGHRFGIIPSALRGELAYSIGKTLQCLTVGFAYMLPGKKPLYAFMAIMASYWL